MVKQLEHYAGVYKENDQPSYINSESIRDRGSKYNWQVTPHVHATLFQIFFIESGNVEVKMTEGRVLLATPGIIIIPPGNVHGLIYDPEIVGHVITVDTVYLDDALKPVIHVLRYFKELVCLTEIAGFDSIMSLVHTIHEEIFESREERLFVIQSLIGVLFVQLHRLNTTANLQTSMAGLNEKYFHAFQKNYTSAKPFTRSIPEFAKELHISAVHLNRICHTITGKSTSLLLQEHAVAAAKKLLAHTSLTITEIAYQLNFTDAAYFTRLFKKLTGKTPLHYRKELSAND